MVFNPSSQFGGFGQPPGMTNPYGTMGDMWRQQNTHSGINAGPATLEAQLASMFQGSLFGAVVPYLGSMLPAGLNPAILPPMGMQDSGAYYRHMHGMNQNVGYGVNFAGMSPINSYGQIEDLRNRDANFRQMFSFMDSTHRIAQGASYDPEIHGVRAANQAMKMAAVVGESGLRGDVARGVARFMGMDLQQDLQHGLGRGLDTLSFNQMRVGDKARIRDVIRSTISEDQLAGGTLTFRGADDGIGAMFSHGLFDTSMSAQRQAGVGSLQAMSGQVTDAAGNAKALEKLIGDKLEGLEQLSRVADRLNAKSSDIISSMQVATGGGTGQLIHQLGMSGAVHQFEELIEVGKLAGMDPLLTISTAASRAASLENMGISGAASLSMTAQAISSAAASFGMGGRFAWGGMEDHRQAAMVLQNRVLNRSHASGPLVALLEARRSGRAEEGSAIDQAIQRAMSGEKVTMSETRALLREAGMSGEAISEFTSDIFTRFHSSRHYDALEEAAFNDDNFGAAGAFRDRARRHIGAGLADEFLALAKETGNLDDAILMMADRISDPGERDAFMVGANEFVGSMEAYVHNDKAVADINQFMQLLSSGGHAGHIRDLAVASTKANRRTTDLLRERGLAGGIATALTDLADRRAAGENIEYEQFLLTALGGSSLEDHVAILDALVEDLGDPSSLSREQRLYLKELEKRQETLQSISNYSTAGFVTRVKGDSKELRFDDHEGFMLRTMDEDGEWSDWESISSKQAEKLRLDAVSRAGEERDRLEQEELEKAAQREVEASAKGDGGEDSDDENAISENNKKTQVHLSKIEDMLANGIHVTFDGLNEGVAKVVGKVVMENA